MAILSKESIFKAKSRDQTFASDFWGGEIKHRLASVGDKIAARLRVKDVKEMCGDSEISEEHFEMAIIHICCVDPSFSITEVKELAEQNGAEVQRLASAILRRPNAKDPL